MAPIKPRLLFLDDRSKRIHAVLNKYSNIFDITIVTNVTECLQFMSQEDWYAWSLDHDLGGKEFVNPNSPECGMEIVRYLEKTTWPEHKKKPIVMIHSSNVFAAEMMAERLKKLGFTCLAQRFRYA